MKKWKTQAHTAIIRSKLLYSLETIQLNPREINRIDAFQRKDIRRILKFLPAFIDRAMTNEFVLKEADRKKR